METEKKIRKTDANDSRTPEAKDQRPEIVMIGSFSSAVFTVCCEIRFVARQEQI